MNVFRRTDGYATIKDVSYELNQALEVAERMLSDRDYMRRSPDPGHRSFRLTGNKLLMVVLVGIYFFQLFFNTATGIALSEYAGLKPFRVVNDFWFWQPFVYQFFQATGQGARQLLEFVFVLIGLFFFGPIVESRWGRKKHILLFCAAGAVAGLIYTPLAYVFRHQSNLLIGAVPSVMAIMVMAAMLRPNLPVLLFFVLPVKMKYMILVFVGLDLFILLQNPGSAGIALAVPHLTGAATGFLYMLYHRPIDRFFEQLEPEGSGSSGRSRRSRRTRGRQDSPYSDEVNEILDKINREGINSLTPDERKLLEKASDQLKEDDRYESFE